MAGTGSWLFCTISEVLLGLDTLAAGPAGGDDGLALAGLAVQLLPAFLIGRHCRLTSYS